MSENIIFEDKNLKIQECGVYEIKNRKHFEDYQGYISGGNIALYGFNKLSQQLQTLQTKYNDSQQMIEIQENAHRVDRKRMEGRVSELEKGLKDLKNLTRIQNKTVTGTMMPICMVWLTE